MKINEAIVVEGIYDKIKLGSIVDANIVTTDGFDIIHNKEKLEYVQKLAETCGIVVLTDSDSAGFRIRNYLKGQIKKGRILHAYIPDIQGKEQRKHKPSKEGLLGVEGVDAETVKNALLSAGCNMGQKQDAKRLITKLDLYKAGLIGGKESAEKRRTFAANLGLPTRLSANALVNALNSVMNYEDFLKTIKK